MLKDNISDVMGTNKIVSNNLCVFFYCEATEQDMHVNRRNMPLLAPLRLCLGTINNRYDPI